MTLTFALLTCAAMAMAGLWYCPLVIRRKVHPVPATWIVGTATMNIGAVAYLSIPGRSIIANVTLLVAALEISVVLCVVLITLHRHGELRIAFDRLQKIVLLIASHTIAYWVGTGVIRGDARGAETTFWIMQFLLVMAYVPTAVKVLKRRTAFDSILNWGFITLGCAFGAVPALVLWNGHGMFNSARGLLSSGLLVTLFIFFDKKEGWKRLRAEVKDNLGWVVGVLRLRRINA